MIKHFDLINTGKLNDKKNATIETSAANHTAHNAKDEKQQKREPNHQFLAK